jgi:hypothetical protein
MLRCSKSRPHRIQHSGKLASASRHWRRHRAPACGPFGNGVA